MATVSLLEMQDAIIRIFAPNTLNDFGGNFLCYTDDYIEPVYGNFKLFGFDYKPNSIDTAMLPCLYPEFSFQSRLTEDGDEQDHWIRDLEFHVALCTISELDRDYYRRAGKIFDLLIQRYTENLDLNVPYLLNYELLGDAGIYHMREYDGKFIGAKLIFRTRSLMKRS